MGEVERVAEGVDPPFTISCDFWVYEGGLFEFKDQGHFNRRALVQEEFDPFTLHSDEDLILLDEALKLFPFRFRHRECSCAIVLYACRWLLVQYNLEIRETVLWSGDKEPRTEV